jgi:hypothetical protein
VHLILASLVHHFNWKLADEMKPEDIDMKEMFGLSVHKAEPLRAIPAIKLFKPNTDVTVHACADVEYVAPTFKP